MILKGDYISPERLKVISGDLRLLLGNYDVKNDPPVWSMIVMNNSVYAKHANLEFNAFFEENVWKAEGYKDGEFVFEKEVESQFQ